MNTKTNIHLYKLVTGESIMAYFHGIENINPKKNINAYIISNPMVIDKYHNFSKWVHGQKNGARIPLKTVYVILAVPEDLIDEVLLERYRMVYDRKFTC